jgi:hypothetical protein
MADVPAQVTRKGESSSSTIRPTGRVHRPVGRDIVVVALLVLSCAGEQVTVDETKTVAEATGKRHVVVEQHHKVTHYSAGCGCTGGGGGRGAVSLPTCERCLPADVDSVWCTIAIAGEPRAPSASTTCAGNLQIVADSEGQRFLVHDPRTNRSEVFVGGHERILAALMDGKREARTVTGVDWSKVPSAVDLLEATYVSETRGDGWQGGGKFALSELRALDPQGFVARLAKLADADVHFDVCRFPSTVWMDVAGKLDDASLERLIALLPQTIPARQANERIALLLVDARALALGA